MKVKPDVQKVIALFVAKGVYPNVQTAIIRDRSTWLVWDVGSYGYWRGRKTAQGHKMRYCWSGAETMGYCLIWDERVVRSRGPKKRVVRTKFALVEGEKQAREKAETRMRNQPTLDYS